jgi:CPA1 family monovalent cation:H+ antiporter
LADIYKIQRKELFLLRQQNRFSDEHIRKAEMQLDLDETKISGGLH